jgi:hypothetical protein
LPSDLLDFKNLISSYDKSLKSAPSRFIKKVDAIPKVVVHPSLAQPLALILEKNMLIGYSTNLWTSPKDMHHWIYLNWRKIIQGQMFANLCGKGFFAFLFEK